MEEDKIFSVSEYIKVVNQRLESCRSKIIGEVSEVNIGPTGHIYFYLKDEKDESVIKCIIWKSKYSVFGVEIKEGVKIIVFGTPSLHLKYGFSFIAETIEHSGEGILKKEYEKLKKKLTEEGLFEEIKKRPIPKYSQKIGIITSRQGGVLADFLNNLGKFGFKVKMLDSRVEGQTATLELLKAVKRIKKEDIEVLVLMRGGGSLEAMQAFNNELLVREIANFPVPVIAAIGHDKNVPLVALAADLAVSTPSIAATTLSLSWEKTLLFLEREERKIISYYEEVLYQSHEIIIQGAEKARQYCDLIFNKYRDIKNELKVSFRSFQNTLLNVKMDLRNSVVNSFSDFKRLLIKIKEQLNYIEKAVNSHDPERQLKLGYSIVKCGNRVIKRTRDTEIGKEIDVRVTDGTIISKVNKINKKNG